MKMSRTVYIGKIPNDEGGGKDLVGGQLSQFGNIESINERGGFYFVTMESIQAAYELVKRSGDICLCGYYPRIEFALKYSKLQLSDLKEKKKLLIDGLPKQQGIRDNLWHELDSFGTVEKISHFCDDVGFVVAEMQSMTDSLYLINRSKQIKLCNSYPTIAAISLEHKRKRTSENAAPTAISTSNTYKATKMIETTQFNNQLTEYSRQPTADVNIFNNNKRQCINSRQPEAKALSTKIVPTKTPILNNAKYQVLCRYWANTNGNCPYGTCCWYSHDSIVNRVK